MTTPMDDLLISKGRLNKNHLDRRENISTAVPYRDAVGSLICLMIGTRPNLSFAVGKLSKFCEKGNGKTLDGFKTCIPLIKRYTNTYGLQFVETDNLQPFGYSDAAWAGDTLARKSIIA